MKSTSALSLRSIPAVAIILAMLAMVGFAILTRGNSSAANATMTTGNADIIALDGSGAKGTATVHRTDHAATMILDAPNLTPGNAYTVWWVIFNNPENCDGVCDKPDRDASLSSQEHVDAVDPHVTLAAGAVADSSGRLVFAATISESFGLRNPGGSLIEGHIRTHGQAPKGNPDAVAAMVSSKDGGCEEPHNVNPGQCTTVQMASVPGPNQKPPVEPPATETTTTTEAAPVPAESGPELMRSKSNWREGATGLEGAAVSGKEHVFLHFDDKPADVAKVHFSVRTKNGNQVVYEKTEWAYPYDLFGTYGDGRAGSWWTRRHANGNYVIEAAVTNAQGQITQYESNIQIGN